MPLVDWLSGSKEKQVSEQGKPFIITENVWKNDVLVYAVNEVISYDEAVRAGLVGSKSPENKVVEAPKPRTSRSTKPKE